MMMFEDMINVKQTKGTYKSGRPPKTPRLSFLFEVSQSGHAKNTIHLIGLYLKTLIFALGHFLSVPRSKLIILLVN